MISKPSFVRAFASLVLAAALPAGVALAHGDSKDKSHSAKSDTAKSDTTQTAEPATSVQGTVAAVTSKDLTVKDTAGNTMKVELSKKTHYDNSGKSGAMKDLRPGMSVSIQGQKQKDGTLRATAVRYDKSAPVQVQPT
jgi:hypothetical protein